MASGFVPAMPATRRKARVRVGAVAAVAIAAGAFTWVVVGDRASSGSPPTVRSPRTASATGTVARPMAMSVASLRAFAVAHSGPVYWAGARAGTVYEVTETTTGRVFVRYLSRADEVGSQRPDYLAVATYPQTGAYAQLQAAARRPGAVTIPAHGGAVAVYDRGRPTSVYLAYPGIDRQIEIYAPTPATARQLVRRGLVGQVR